MVHYIYIIYASKPWKFSVIHYRNHCELGIIMHSIMFLLHITVFRINFFYIRFQSTVIAVNVSCTWLFRVMNSDNVTLFSSIMPKAHSIDCWIMVYYIFTIYASNQFNFSVIHYRNQCELGTIRHSIMFLLLITVFRIYFPI